MSLLGRKTLTWDVFHLFNRKRLLSVLIVLFFMLVVSGVFLLAFRLARQDHANAVTAYMAALEFKREGNMETAVQEFHRAIDKDPRLGDAWLHLAEWASSRGQFSQAVKFAAKAVKRLPQSRKAWFVLGKLTFTQHQYDEAVQALKRAIQLSHYPDADLVSSLGAAQLRTGNLEQAEATLRQSLEIDPLNANTFNNLGIFYKLRKEYERALFYFKKAENLDPRHADAIYNQGVVLHLMGREEESKKRFEAAKRLTSGSNK